MLLQEAHDTYHTHPGMLRIAALAGTVTLVAGHGAVVKPRPRNSVDNDLPPWNGKVPANPPSVESFTGWCPAVDENGTISGKNGQSCFWVRPASSYAAPPPAASPQTRFGCAVLERLRGWLRHVRRQFARPDSQMRDGPDQALPGAEKPDWHRPQQGGAGCRLQGPSEVYPEADHV